LQKTAAAAAAVVIRFIWGHINEVLFPHQGRYNKPQIVSNGVSKTLAYDLTRILDRKLDLQILVPIRIDLEFPFSDPLGVVLVNTGNFKLVFDVEFFQSGPNRKCDVASFRIEKDLASQFIGLFG